MTVNIAKKLGFWIKNDLNVLFVGKHGVGKCLGKGTPVLLYNGKIIPVELVREGDLLMGPDSQPRKVLSLARGKDEMYKIIPHQGDAFVCNSVHILTLKMSDKDEPFDIPLNEFQKKDKIFRSQAMMFRVGVNFEESTVPQSAYLLGLWLGNKCKKNQLSRTLNKTSVSHLSENKSSFFYFLEQHKLLSEKYIPHVFLTASVEDRLQLLAGLLDSINGELSNNCYYVTIKSNFYRLSQDILFLARSLGMAAHISSYNKYVFYKRKFRKYYRITISGNIDQIPCFLSRKIDKKDLEKNNVLNTGIKKIIPLGKGDYYGFTLDGDGRFLLGDFTVTHNTAMVKQAFQEHHLNWRYFSASTMDPWVDFVGVPKEKTEGKFGSDQFEIIRELLNIDKDLALEWIEKNWHMSVNAAQKIVQNIQNRNQFNYLELVRPRTFATGEVEALFFDEFNRSPKKVRNAVMELLQFKSINGEKFPNLRIVWAAINPDDDENDTYDVEKLDPAQQDRYHVITTIPYLPNTEWFREKFGRRLADSAIGWWKELPEEMKNIVSPRRLEYALNMYQINGDLRDIIPNEAGVTKLTDALRTGPISEKLMELMESNNIAEARVFLANENNFAAAMKFITESNTLIDFFMPLISKEKIASSMADNAKIRKHIIMNSDKVPTFMNVCNEILVAGIDQKMIREIRKSLQQNQELAHAFAVKNNGGNIEAEIHYTEESSSAFTGILIQLRRFNTSTSTPQIKHSVYEKIERSIPKDMTAEQALNTLEILNDTIGNMWPSTLSSQPFVNLPGIINHCIKEICRNTGHSWEMIIDQHRGRFDRLMTAIKKAGLSYKIIYNK